MTAADESVALDALIELSKSVQGLMSAVIRIESNQQELLTHLSAMEGHIADDLHRTRTLLEER